LLSIATGDSVDTVGCSGIGEVVCLDGDAGLTAGVVGGLVDGATADPPHAAKSATIATPPITHVVCFLTVRTPPPARSISVVRRGP
jgi:hypothetical protein